MARRRVSEAEELALNIVGNCWKAFTAALQYSLRNPQTGDLLHDRVQGEEMGHPLIDISGRPRCGKIPGDTSLGVAREVEVSVNGGPHGQVSHVDTGFAKTLHGHEADHGPGPFRTRGATTGAPLGLPCAPRRKIGLFRSPLPCQRPHIFGRNRCLIFLPLRCFWNTILLAQDVILPFFKARGSQGDILLVIQVLGDPNIGDRQGQGIAGVRSGSKPLASKQGRRIVVIGIDVHHFDPQLAHPLSANSALEGTVGTGGGFRVTGPEHDHVAFFEGILHGTVRLRRSQTHAVPPMMHGPPVPSLPTIRILHNGCTAHELHKPSMGAQIIADISPHMVRSRSRQNGTRPRGPFDPFNLVGHDIQGLVPTNAFISGDPPVLAMASTLWIEINSFHGIHEPIR